VSPQSAMHRVYDAMRDRAINVVEERLGRFASRGGDWYSALHRPGSWEATTDQGRHGLELLEEFGFRPVQDPSAPWRILWRDTPQDTIAEQASP
jgi:hypothetical protein